MNISFGHIKGQGKNNTKNNILVRCLKNKDKKIPEVRDLEGLLLSCCEKFFEETIKVFSFFF